VAVRSTRLSSNRLTTFDKVFDNRLDVCLHDTAGCQTGCQTGCTTGLTTGCIVFKYRARATDPRHSGMVRKELGGRAGVIRRLYANQQLAFD